MKVKLIATLCLFFSSIAFTHAQYTINDTFGDLTTCDTMTRGIYIVWWDKVYDIADDVDVMLDSMMNYRKICLEQLNMQDPPSPEDGYYCNIYVHASGHFGDLGWGNGVGTDTNGYPYYTAPLGGLEDWNNLAHETFHLFQYNANSPGFAYSGNSQWYIEASANWFAARQNPESPRRFIEAESLVRLPQVPLWLSFGNFPDYYPENWQRYVHQYALALQLYYLTDVVGIDKEIITSGLYGMVDEYPQEYFYNQVGASAYRQHFIDWAIHMTNDFDFLPQEQKDANLDEWNTYADPEDDYEYILQLENEGTDGWYYPKEDEITHAWSYNVYKLDNTEEAKYTFMFVGDFQGTKGDLSYFQGKILVKNPLTGDSFYDLDLENDYTSQLTLDLTEDDNEVYFLIASMPQVFGDEGDKFQQFSYQMQIIKSTVNSTDESQVEKIEMKRIDLLGREITKDYRGLQVILYTDGTSKLIFEQ